MLSIWGRKISQERRWGAAFFSSTFLLIAVVLALLLAGVVGILEPSIWGFVVGAIVMVTLVVMRQYNLAAIAIVVIHIYFDWYLGLGVTGTSVVFVLLVIRFFFQSPHSPWIAPRALWLWGLFLLLTISPAVQGATSRNDLAYYYPNIIFGALLMFWLGTVITRDSACLRGFFKILAGLGTFLAILTIIQASTGILWLASSHFDAYLARASNFQLGDTGIYRLGAFFINPDWNGTFFAIILFIPLGLFIESSSPLEKALYLVETFFILPALLSTFSVGAWIATIVGLVVFVTLVGRVTYRVQISAFIVVAAMLLLIGFSQQTDLLFQRGSNADLLAQRNGAWSTAIRVIQAHPLTGIGLGLQNYLQHAEPYRVPAQVIPLAHPHNSYLELGAMAGLPVLIVFVALIAFALWQALRNWAHTDRRNRSLLAGGIAAIIVLSVNSLSVNGWTLPPIAATGWLVLGAISSPLLAMSRNRKDESK